MNGYPLVRSANIASSARHSIDFCILIVVSLVSLCSLIPTRSIAEEEGQLEGRIPQELIDKVTGLLEQMAPEGENVVDDNIREGLLFHFKGHCQEFVEHNVHPGGEIQKSRSHVVPAVDGFDLKLTWFVDSGEEGQTGTFYYAHIFPGAYCQRYMNSYKLPDDRGYVYMNYDFGSQVNPGILKAVRAELEAVGTPVREEVPDAWEEKVVTLQTRLTETVKARQPDGQWRRDGRSLICEFKTMTFDIHAVDEKGLVSPEAHQEVGPEFDGFIIQLSPVQAALRRQPRPHYGRSYSPYWRHYFTLYQEHDQPFRLDILYGVRTDKKLLEEVTDAVDDLFGKPERF